MIIHRYADFEVGHALIIRCTVYLFFLVDLTQIYQTAVYESEYEHLSFLCMSQHLFRLQLIFF
jgi:hypothetical protein